MARNIEKVKLRKIIQEESLKQQRKGALVISCKNKEYNFYSSGKFDENDPKALASHGWKHRKSYIARDFFTINAVSTVSVYRVIVLFKKFLPRIKKLMNYLKC